MRRYTLWAVLICVVAGIGHWLTQRPGHDFDGDFAMYVMQARSIVEGHPRSVEFIPNPANPVAPAAYPPMLPLLLAPVYALSGLQMEPLKLVPLISLVGWLFMIALTARRFVGDRLALATTALIGVHPAIWDSANSIYSEFPFAFFTYACLLVVDSRSGQAGRGVRDVSTYALLAACLLASLLTRTAAIVLFPAIYLAAVWQTRRIVNWTIWPLAVALACWLGVSALLPQDHNTYIHYLDGLSLWSLHSAEQDYLAAVAYLAWPIESGTLITIVVLTVVLPLMTLGLFSRLQQRMTVFEVFAAGYCALLLLFPAHWEAVRYLLPLWPLLLLYVMRGALRAGQLIGGRLSLAIPAAVLASLVASYAMAFSARSLAPVDPSVTSPPAVALFQEIERRVPRDAVVLARKPTILALYTRRRSSAWNRTFAPEEFWNYAKQIHAGYLVQDRFQFGDGQFDPADSLDQLVENEPENLELIYANEWYRVFRLLPPATQEPGTSFND